VKKTTSHLVCDPNGNASVSNRVIYSNIEISMGGCAVIDFKDEISKYKPVRTVDDVEDGIKDEILDIMDLLQYISGKTSANDAGRV